MAEVGQDCYRLRKDMASTNIAIISETQSGQRSCFSREQVLHWELESVLL